MLAIIATIIAACAVTGLVIAGLAFCMAGNDADQAIAKLRELRGEPTDREGKP